MMMALLLVLMRYFCDCIGVWVCVGVCAFVCVLGVLLIGGVQAAPASEGNLGGRSLSFDDLYSLAAET